MEVGRTLHGSAIKVAKLDATRFSSMTCFNIIKMASDSIAIFRSCTLLLSDPDEKILACKVCICEESKILR